jgi:hypothetical protein
LAQHRIELDTSIPLPHQARYRLNPNYVAIVKQNIDKLLAAIFFQPVGYMVITHSASAHEEWQIENLCGFQEAQYGNQKNPYPLPFFDEVLNIVARYEAY